ncbi:MAG: glycosyltransferase family 2 protein [Luteibaculaceae bacterium]
MLNVSVVVPLYNEEESLPELVAWVSKVCDKNQLNHEIILVDDGSTDSSWQVIEKLAEAFPALRAIKFRTNYGKSAALNEGFKMATGEVVITMDADLQDSPDEIPDLYAMVKNEGFDLVSGWKQKRYDPISKTIPSKFFNWVTAKLSGIDLHDFNCGLKAYNVEVIKTIEVYGEMHRYIPVIAKWNGFKKIGEKPVQHRSRQYGVTKFGLERFVNGFLDLLTILFITQFGKKPMHLFGTLGSLMFILGFGLLLYSGIDKLYLNPSGRLIAQRAEFYVFLTLVILGVQFFLAGFIAELSSRNSPNRNVYQIKTTIR